MRSLLLLVLLLSLPAAAQKIAIWNPEQGTSQPPNRFVLDLPRLAQTAQYLQDAGLSTEKLTVAQLADETAFNATKYDALIMPGDSFPKIAIKSLQDFSDSGGILVALNARIPFNARIEQVANGQWDLTPNQGYAWQSMELLNPLGVKYIYDPQRHDQGVLHTPSPLLKNYVPDAPVLKRKMPSVWLVPMPGAQFFPLIRSQRLDGADVQPQLFVTRSGKRTAIISLSPIWTEGTDPAIWSFSKETAVALAKLAVDLKAGKAKLTDPISIPEDMAPPRPLTTRTVSGEVNPEGIPALQRWGKFDGSSTEWGAALTANSSRQAASTAEASSLPGVLESGARLELALKNPLAEAGAFLRVRGAFVASNAGLKVECGGKTFWNELFEYTDPGGAGNSSPDLAGVPSEFSRCVYLPAAGAKSVIISNSGKQPLYFDAVQLEAHPAPGPRYVVGAMLVDLGTSGERLPVELSSEWGLVRSNMRTQYAGPAGDPDRFKQQDLLWARFKKSGAPIHFVFEGTPEWAAISPDRYAAAQATHRPHTTVPDTDKYLELAGAMLDRYGKDAKVYEIWNEVDINTFWRGTPEEYAAFFKVMAALIRKRVPDATIVSAGLAGFRENIIDVLAAQGVFQSADWVGFHPYAGQSTAWDIAFGQMQGKLYSLGIEKPIYCDESGFTWKGDEWFKDNWTPEKQKQWLDIAMSRLFSDGLTKFNIFHASASDHSFDLIDKNGLPRPAYAVFRDYVQLGLKAGRHIDLSLTPDGGAPLQGTGVAAAQHDDGSTTIILNPAQSPLASRAVTLRLPAKFTSATARDESGPVTVTVAANEVHLSLQSRTVLKLTP